MISGSTNSLSTYNAFITRAFSEYMKIINFLSLQDSQLSYSVVGDFLLTTSSSQSRNRTLGEQIAKGLYDPSSSNNSIVLEGLKSLNFFTDSLKINLNQNSILFNLKKLIDGELDCNEFLSLSIT